MLEMETAIMVWKCKSDISDLVLGGNERKGEVDKVFLLGEATMADLTMFLIMVSPTGTVVKV